MVGSPWGHLWATEPFPGRAPFGPRVAPRRFGTAPGERSERRGQRRPGEAGAAELGGLGSATPLGHGTAPGETARKDSEKLHEQIRGHAVDVAEAEAFLTMHAGLHHDDLELCRSKLQDLKEACRAAEKPLRQHLRQLYNKTGCDLQDLEQCLVEVEDAATARLRRRRLEQQLRVLEDYAESVSVILGQREELKALVVAGASFERAAQAGEGPRPFHGHATPCRTSECPMPEIW
eukprot:Skav229739  [mRNA]  locus=scaffold1287:249347:254690:+ [translate_table: standard]